MSVTAKIPGVAVTVIAFWVCWGFIGLGSAAAKGQALCVGINEFSNLDREYWLKGSVQDANDMEALPAHTKKGFCPRGHQKADQRRGHQGQASLPHWRTQFFGSF